MNKIENVKIDGNNASGTINGVSWIAHRLLNHWRLLNGETFSRGQKISIGRYLTKATKTGKQESLSVAGSV